jgi:hypothetical protein
MDHFYTKITSCSHPDGNPKFGLNVNNVDTTHNPGGYQIISYLHKMVLGDNRLGFQY